MLQGFYLVLVSLKAHHVFTAPPPLETGAPYANIGANTGSISININALEYDGGGVGSSCTATPTMTPLAGAGAGPGRRVPASASAVAPAVTPPIAVAPAIGGGGGSVVEATGKLGGGSVGGPCGPRRQALTETVAHLAFLSAMAVRQRQRQRQRRGCCGGGVFMVLVPASCGPKRWLAPALPPHLRMYLIPTVFVVENVGRGFLLVVQQSANDGLGLAVHALRALQLLSWLVAALTLRVWTCLERCCSPHGNGPGRPAENTPKKP